MDDFSHIRKWGIVRDIDRYDNGEQLSDYQVAALAGQFNPPLLSKNDMRIIRKELSSKPRKRGAPVGGRAQRRIVADKLKLLERNDVPSSF